MLAKQLFRILGKQLLGIGKLSEDLSEMSDL